MLETHFRTESRDFNQADHHLRFFKGRPQESEAQVLANDT